MRATLLALGLFTTGAYAQDPALPSGPELGELRYACFGDDAETMTGSRKAANEACKQWDDIQAKAEKAGLCLDAEAGFSWKSCT